MDQATRLVLVSALVALIGVIVTVWTIWVRQREAHRRDLMDAIEG